MRSVLFLSPHLDDAVFSCAARILHEVEMGARVTVATVFSHARRHSSQSADYVARRAEDRRALQALGASPRWLGLLDAPWRNPFYNSFQRIVLETAPGEEECLALVRDRLDRLCRELKPATIYVPLAVGTHIDHRMVFAAASSLPTPGAKVFYEDRPYALVDAAVELRLKNIGVAAKVIGVTPAWPSKPVQFTRYLRSFCFAPYVRRYLPPGSDRKRVEAILGAQFASPAAVNQWFESEIEHTRPSDLRRIVDSIYSYRSQVRLFLGSRKEFVRASRRHAATLGLRGDRVERFWKPLQESKAR